MTSFASVPQPQCRLACQVPWCVGVCVSGTCQQSEPPCLLGFGRLPRPLLGIEELLPFYQLHCCLQTGAHAQATAFYEDAAAAAGALNVCVDVWAASAEGCGLAAMLPLTRGCGGCVNSFPCSQLSGLPQVRSS